MEDVLTEIPTPSRFSEDDLDNFAVPDPPLPSLFLISNPTRNPSRRSRLLLLLLISPSPLSLPPKTLISSLFLPEVPLSTPRRSSPVGIYSLDSDPSVLVADASACHVSAARSKAAAKILVREFQTDRIVVFDSIKGENYRGRLSEAAVLKLETKEERKSVSGSVKGVERLGAGSLVEGMAAAMMGECEMRRRKGTLVVTWPETGREVAGGLKNVMRDLGIKVGNGEEGMNSAAAASSWMQSDLYT